MLRLMCLVALLLALVVQPGLAADEPVLLVGTEASADGEVRPSQELVSVVLRAIDRRDIELLDECLSEQGLRQADYASLLRAVRIDAGGGRNLWFVRPALRPYCFALYGAHAFHYFLIEERPSGSSERYRLLFQNRGDFFAVYRQQSHGLNDIEATGCIVSECRSARMSFDGRQYRPVQCTCTTWDSASPEGVTRQRQCGSDFRDDQSSGFARRCGS